MELNSVIVKFDKNLSMQENVKNLVVTECNLNKALKEIRKVSSFYRDEIDEQKAKLHITKGGQVLFLDEMEDSHLINTVKLLLRNNDGRVGGGMKKYVAEIKRRNLVSEVINYSDVADAKLDEAVVDEDESELW